MPAGAELSPTQRPRDGFALVLVLWGLALLSVIAGSLVKSLRVEATVAQNEVAVAQARAVADAGVYRGIYALLENGPEGRWSVDGTTYEVPVGERTAVVSVQAETGKIDVNRADEELLKNLLLTLSLDGQTADSLGEAILDWRDEDDSVRLNGAETAAYENAGLPYGPRNEFFSSVDELQQVIGMTPAVFARIYPLVTIYSGLTGINPAVAPRGVLMSLPGIVPAEVEAFLAAREQNWHTDIDLPLPVLSGVGARLAGEEGTVYTISARPAGGSGFFLREAVVWTPPDGERPYWILDWRRGALPLSPDGEEELELPE